MWIDEKKLTQDYYVAFRATFEIRTGQELEVQTCGSGWFVAWLDGEFLTEGPARFEKRHPEYVVLRRKLAPGRHVIAVQAQHLGVTTRMLDDMPPFLFCRLLDAKGQTVSLAWKCLRLSGYESAVRRINPQLGWIEWCRTAENPEGWEKAGFDDAAWNTPVEAGPEASAMQAAEVAPVRQIKHVLRAVAEGPLAEGFGYERDDIPARFFLRNLTCEDVPPQGVWRRYDLGRVRLGRPSFVIDAPAGAVIEFAYCEHLAHGRVTPYITLSAGASCNLDHYVARGGPQRFEPITPKGGRYLEVHVLADPNAIHFAGEGYLERTYNGEAEGAFSCNDELLNRIWAVGVETYRACSEDAIIDNPTRERGQWTGDVVSVGLNIACATYADLRLFKRALIQSALCARKDGLVSGMSPGGDVYVSTYAAQWFSACLDYYRFTGDRGLLEQLYPHALRNWSAFEAHAGPNGLDDKLSWTFVDWGYDRGTGPMDPGLNLHYLAGLRALELWCGLLGKEEDRARCERQAEQISTVMQAWFADTLRQPGSWEKIGYHAAALGLSLGFVAETDQAACIDGIKRHILSCFPNDASAPRLSDPAAVNRRIITPYFAHFAFPALIEHGEMDFVLDQYRACWGWALQEGRTTWVEVFDPRWSHCHQWAGCPTWQLSCYGLGLWHRYDWGDRHLAFHIRPGRLQRVSGKVPLPGNGGTVDVAWERSGAGIQYSIECAAPVFVHGLDPLGAMEKAVEIQGKRTFLLPSA